MQLLGIWLLCSPFRLCEQVLVLGLPREYGDKSCNAGQNVLENFLPADLI